MPSNFFTVIPIIKKWRALAASRSESTNATLENVGMAVKNNLLGGMHGLLRALNTLKALHPFIGPLVLAFQAVQALVATIQANEHKVLELCMSMRDLMTVLLSLKDVPKHQLLVWDQLKARCADAAADMDRCVSTCRAYNDCIFLAKVFRALEWDRLFGRFLGIFQDHRATLSVLLLGHMAHGIDGLHEKVDRLAEALAEALKHPAEEFKRLQDIVDIKGREAFLHDDEALRELQAQATRLSPPESRVAEASMSVEQLKASLFADAERPVGEGGPTPSAPAPTLPPDQPSETTRHVQVHSASYPEEQGFPAIDLRAKGVTIVGTLSFGHVSLAGHQAADAAPTRVPAGHDALHTPGAPGKQRTVCGRRCGRAGAPTPA